jgi:hypothetical protein
MPGARITRASGLHAKEEITMSRRFTPSLEVLAARLAPSATNPLDIPPPKPEPVELVEYLTVQELIDRGLMDKFIEGLRQLQESEQHNISKPPPIPESPPVDASPTEVKTWWDALDQILKDAMEAQVPIFHP